MPMKKNRHRVLSFAAIAGGGDTPAIDASAYQVGLFLVTSAQDCFLQGSPDGGTTWFTGATLTGGAATSVFPVPQLLRVRAGGAGATVHVDLIRNVGD